MFDVYLACLSNAVLHRRAALQIELSVGLCVALDLIDDPALGRVTLTNVYSSAGYDCLVPDGKDYKTINRRVNIAFLLFDKLGAEIVTHAARGLSGHRRVESVQAMLAPLQLHAMDDVLTFCGRSRAGQPSKPQRQPLTPENNPGRRAIDQAGTIHVRTENLDIPIPPTVTRAELMRAARELIKMADTFDEGKLARRREGRANQGEEART